MPSSLTSGCSCLSIARCATSSSMWQRHQQARLWKYQSSPAKARCWRSKRSLFYRSAETSTGTTLPLLGQCEPKKPQPLQSGSESLSGINASIGDALRTDRAHACDGAKARWITLGQGALPRMSHLLRQRFHECGEMRLPGCGAKVGEVS